MNQALPEIVFRPMTAKDIPAALDLWSRLPGLHVSVGDEPETLKAYLRRHRRMSQVALVEGELVGAVLAGHDGRRGYLYHLAVDPAHGKRGIGRELVRRSTEAIWSSGLGRCIILVADDNDDGLAFWERGGWERFDAFPMGFDRPGS